MSAGQLLAPLGEQLSLEHPEMLRKYGRNDYQRFDHLRPLLVPHGSAAIGKVIIDCRFLFTKSKWGAIDGSPAGIVYMDLSFKEPKGCRLHSATVTITLDDEQQELRGLRRPHGARHSHDPVRMTDYYGPHSFVGAEKMMHKKKNLRFHPNADFAGFGAGLGEISSQTSSTVSSRWKFSGHLVAGKEGTARHFYKSIAWELSENDFEKESHHSSVFHTAFAFQHGSQPFFLRVDIDGKLKGTHRVFSKLSRLRASTRADDTAAVTLINFNQHHIFDRPLDAFAKGLRFEMEKANLEAVPTEIWEPQQAAYQSLPPTAPPSVHSSDTPPPIQNYFTLPQTGLPQTGLPQRPLLQPAAQATPVLPWQRDAVAQVQPDLQTLVDLANLIHADLSTPLPDETPQLLQQESISQEGSESGLDLQAPVPEQDNRPAPPTAATWEASYGLALQNMYTACAHILMNMFMLLNSIVNGLAVAVVSMTTVRQGLYSTALKPGGDVLAQDMRSPAENANMASIRRRARSTNLTREHDESLYF